MDLNVKSFEYSLKNIPIPGKNEYMGLLIEKVQTLIRRVRWKAFFYEKALSISTGTDNPTGTGTSRNVSPVSGCTYTGNSSVKQSIASGKRSQGFDTNYADGNFGGKFPSNIGAPSNLLLNGFENALYDLIKSITFQPIKNDFQEKLKKDAIEIKKSDKIFVFADKSNNTYKVEKSVYKKLLHENVTKNYKKTTDSVINKIDLESKKIAESLKMDHKIQCFAHL